MNREINESLKSVKNAIKRTKKYLNHEFRDYYTNIVYLEPKEWLWVTESFRTIENEKPNLPIAITQSCTRLYTDIFQVEANIFLDYCREGLEVRSKRLSEKEIQKTIWNQYDLWRTKFTTEANLIIQTIDSKLVKNISNEISSNKDFKSLKTMVTKGKFMEIIDILINDYELNKEIQNQLY